MFENTELANGTLILTVELRKSWSKLSTYFVHLVSVPLGPTTCFYAVRQWKFHRREDNKDVTGEVCSPRELSLCRVMTVAEMVVRDKILHSDYVLHNLKEVNATAAAPCQDIASFFATLQKISVSAPTPDVDKWPPQECTVELAESAAKNETEATAFAEAVQRRKREAKWR
jgi:hypothetical protein